MKSERILGLFVIGVLLVLIVKTLLTELYPNLFDFVQEGFTITRASDCNCLPGYIPSNIKEKKETSIFFCQKLNTPSETKPCY
jgi:hypothetical protein